MRITYNKIFVMFGVLFHKKARDEGMLSLLMLS